MIRLHLTFIFFLALLCSCEQKKTATTAINGPTDSLVADSANVNAIGDTIITTPCAIIIMPTLDQIDSLKKDGDLEDFYTAADDNLWYIAKAREFLDSMKVKTFDWEAKGIVTFKTRNITSNIDLSKLIWGILLFNGKNPPKEVYGTDIEPEFDSYMNGKDSLRNNE